MKEFLGERLTFDQLFRKSEPGRVKRSTTVRGPPMEIDGHSDSVYHTFNFKSFPSTTGLRHHGYVRFFRPHRKDVKNTPLQHIPCEVDCTCPDFRYRWAWVLKQHGSSRVGPQSMNQAWNKVPKITNRTKRISLCKHILAARDYIYGMLAQFKGTPDTEEKLAQLIKYADRRWTDWQGQSRNAKDREAWFKAAKVARAQGKEPPPGPPPMYRPAAGKPGFPPPPEEPTATPTRPVGPILPKAGKPKVAPKVPLAVPPGERGRTLSPAPPPGAAGITPPSKRGRGLPPIGRARRESLVTRVSRVNGSRSCEDQKTLTESMTNLNEAIKVVEEIEQDELAAPTEIEGGLDSIAVDAPPPSEPPVSDDAVGADTEGNVVLQLLADIKDLLGELVAVETGEEEAEGEPGEEGEPDENRPVDAIPEPPEDEEEEDNDEEGRPGAAPSVD
jgi:hypothetical protein